MEKNTHISQVTEYIMDDRPWESMSLSEREGLMNALSPAEYEAMRLFRQKAEHCLASQPLEPRPMDPKQLKRAFDRQRNGSRKISIAWMYQAAAVLLIGLGVYFVGPSSDNSIPNWNAYPMMADSTFHGSIGAEPDSMKTEEEAKHQ